MHILSFSTGEVGNMLVLQTAYLNSRFKTRLNYQWYTDDSHLLEEITSLGFDGLINKHCLNLAEIAKIKQKN